MLERLTKEKAELANQLQETQAANKKAQDAYQAQLNTKQQEAQTLQEKLNKSQGKVH